MTKPRPETGLWLGAVLICTLCAGWFAFKLAQPAPIYDQPTLEQVTLPTATRGIDWARLTYEGKIYFRRVENGRATYFYEDGSEVGLRRVVDLRGAVAEVQRLRLAAEFKAAK